MLAMKVLGILVTSAIIGGIFGRGVYRYQRTNIYPEVPEEEVYFWILRHGRLKTAMLVGGGAFIISLILLYLILIWM